MMIVVLWLINKSVDGSIVVQGLLHKPALKGEVYS